MESGIRGDSMEKLKGLRISSIDDEEQEEDIVVDEDDYVDDDEEEEEEQEPVTLGFVEKPKNKWSLLRQLFPSKVGGSPAWLDPVNLPSEKSCLCDICGEPLQFLLQVYAPIDEKDSTFHRMLYVFMCPSMTCLLRDQHEQWKRSIEKPCRSVKVFRCQLPQSNPFYSSEPPRNNGKDEPSGPGVASNILWPEYEVLNEDERDFDTDMSEDNGLGNALITKTGEDDTMKSLLSSFEGDAERKSWAAFQECITKAPEQVLRYCRSTGAKVLWPMASGRPSKTDIPSCAHCGGSLCFEFQILPQLLYYLGVKNDVDSLDWATVAVYTCAASCDASVSYKEEFVWVQLYSQTLVS